MSKVGVRPGSAQRRQRQQMHRRGWRSITTFVRVDHYKSLKEIQTKYQFGTLHEALEFALNRSVIEPDNADEPQSNGRSRLSANGPAARTSDASPAKESAP